jgi:hypothetical protein
MVTLGAGAGAGIVAGAATGAGDSKTGLKTGAGSGFFTGAGAGTGFGAALGAGLAAVFLAGAGFGVDFFTGAVFLAGGFFEGAAFLGAGFAAGFFAGAFLGAGFLAMVGVVVEFYIFWKLTRFPPACRDSSWKKKRSLEAGRPENQGFQSIFEEEGFCFSGTNRVTNLGFDASRAFPLQSALYPQLCRLYVFRCLVFQKFR